MMVSKETLRVVAKLLQRIQSDYAERSGAKLDDPPPHGQVLKELEMGHGALLRAQHLADEALTPRPDGTDQHGFQEGWLDLSLGELLKFNENGSGFVGSCSEALLKVHGVMNAWFSDPNGRGRIFFRGEHKWGWELKPRLGRRRLAKPDNQDQVPVGATPVELQLLADFQSRVLESNELLKEVFESRDPPTRDHPAWWSIMQHYDATFGTRMIDITSSIFCGLYFACADWNGEVDEEFDGRLYLFPNQKGATRGEAESPDMIQGELNDSNDRAMRSAASYFTIEAPHDVARFRESPIRNSREIAQDGFFFWQPRFWEPLDAGQHLEFRVARTQKLQILRELYSIGYTAQRIVRGKRGEEAHAKLQDKLGIPAL